MDSVLKIAQRVAKKLFPMYCQHFNGAFCDACAPGVIAAALRERDAAWNRAIGYKVATLALTPEEAKGWLETDRRRQVQNAVRESSPRFREVKHY